METLDLIGLEKSEKTFKPWMPKRVLFTPDALEEEYGKEIYERIQRHNIPIEILKSNRLTNLRGSDERETYRLAKTTFGGCKSAAIATAAATHSTFCRLAVSFSARLPGALPLLLSRRLVIGSAGDTGKCQPALHFSQLEKLPAAR